MSLRLYDTATASVRDFVPLQDGRVGLYLCGATVQSEPHIGHLRSAVAFDQLWRWLEAGHGYDVTFVRNVTDIDDKILAKSQEAGVEWWAWALQHERAFTAAYDAIGLRRPTYEPRATGHVTEMVELMQRLEERGHAYRAEDGSSDVYFDVRSWEGYGTPDPPAARRHGSRRRRRPARQARPARLRAVEVGEAGRAGDRVLAHAVRGRAVPAGTWSARR